MAAFLWILGFLCAIVVLALILSVLTAIGGYGPAPRWARVSAWVAVLPITALGIVVLDEFYPAFPPQHQEQVVRVVIEDHR